MSSGFTHVGPEGIDVGVSHVLDGRRVLPSGEATVVPAELEAAVIRAALSTGGKVGQQCLEDDLLLEFESEGDDGGCEVVVPLGYRHPAAEGAGR